MHRHCGTNNRAPRWTFTDPCKPEVRPGAREESAYPAWLAAPAMNARDTTKVYMSHSITKGGLWHDVILIRNEDYDVIAVYFSIFHQV